MTDEELKKKVSADFDWGVNVTDEELRKKISTEFRLQHLADYAIRDAMREVVIVMIKQEARDIKMVRPDEDEKVTYEEAARRAKQRLVDAIQTACNGRCTGS